jgi:phage recombination protein Bet
MNANLNMHETQASTGAKSLGAKRARISKVKSPEANIILRAVEKSGLSYQAFVDTLTQTAFQGVKFWRESDLERLLVTAHRYELDPLNREIMMFEVGLAEPPELLLVVGVDGWAKIMNAHPQFDGIAFVESQELIGEVPSWIECTIYRKDRKIALSIKEYFAEARNDQMVWITHPRRMLRHKALVQCARLSFGLAGIYEPDEAMRIRQSKRQSTRLKDVSGKEEIIQKLRKAS